MVHHGRPHIRRSGAGQQAPHSRSPPRQSGKDEVGGSSPPAPGAHRNLRSGHRRPAGQRNVPFG